MAQVVLVCISKHPIIKMKKNADDEASHYIKKKM